MKSREQNEEIAQLRTKRKKELDRFNFDEVKRIDKRIQEIHLFEKREEISRIYDAFEDELEKHLQNHIENTKEIEKYYQQNLQDIKLKYHKKFQLIQKKHLESLSALEEEYTENKMKQNKRGVPQQLKILESAKKEAILGNYEKALELKDLSRTIAQKNVEERLNKIEENFIESRSKLIDQQRLELLQMSESFRAEKERAKEVTDEKHIQNNNNRDVRLIAIFHNAVININKVGGRKSAKEAYSLFSEIMKDNCSKYQCPFPVLPLLNDIIANVKKYQSKSSVTNHRR